MVYEMIAHFETSSTCPPLSTFDLPLSCVPSKQPLWMTSAVLLC